MARFTSETISVTVYLGWLPWTTAKTVYPRLSSGSKKAGWIASWDEKYPPLTISTTAEPFAPFFGVRTSIVSAVPNFRP